MPTVSSRALISRLEHYYHADMFLTKLEFDIAGENDMYRPTLECSALKFPHCHDDAWRYIIYRPGAGGLIGVCVLKDWAHS